jgi:hypothetical protein
VRAFCHVDRFNRFSTVYLIESVKQYENPCSRPTGVALGTISKTVIAISLKLVGVDCISKN